MSFDIGDKYGDSRDIEKIIKDLEFDIECINDDIEELKDDINDINDEHEDDFDLMGEDERKEVVQSIKTLEKDIESKELEKYDVEQELKKYEDFRDEFVGYCSWKHGVTLIHEDYFKDYLKNDLLPDIYGEVFENLPSWLESNIDWDGVAEDFKVDYTSGDIEGHTYWAI